ncbi:hypothetical protein [Lacipirellula sp.]|uniref:hypothetical protein n=1 Tax=Lacipirellula sp. TaxID=2691419 RepID=UPI003D1519E9
MPVQVLAVLPGNTAVVSTDRVFRVVAGDNRAVVEEFLDVHQAATAVALLRRSGQLAEAVPYSALAEEERDDDWKFQYSTEYPQVLAILPRCVVVSSVGLYRVAREDGVPVHEFCDLDKAESLAVNEFPGEDRDETGAPAKFFVRSYDSLVDPAAKPLTNASSGVATDSLELASAGP